jgi:hypothetical protein
MGIDETRHDQARDRRDRHLGKAGGQCGMIAAGHHDAVFHHEQAIGLVAHGIGRVERIVAHAEDFATKGVKLTQVSKLSLLFLKHAAATGEVARAPRLRSRPVPCR